MRKSTDLTAYAIEGYEGKPCVHLATSSKWFAYRLGEYFKRTGQAAPRDVRMGRGYQIHANDVLFAFDSRNAIMRMG